MSILSRYDLFIFDWDNTLGGSQLTDILHKLKNSFSVRDARKHAQKYMPSVPIKNMEIEEDASRLYSSIYDLYSKVFRPKLKPETTRLLKFLKERGKKVAIFSDSKTYRLFSETRHFGIVDYLDIAPLAAEAIRQYKPNPAGILIILDRLKVSNSRSVYIGDMAVDILTAKLAGIDSFGIADGLDTKDKLRSAGASRIFPNLGVFLGALQKQ